MSLRTEPIEGNRYGRCADQRIRVCPTLVTCDHRERHYAGAKCFVTNMYLQDTWTLPYPPSGYPQEHTLRVHFTFSPSPTSPISPRQSDCRLRGSNGVKCHRIQARRSRDYLEFNERENVKHLCGIHAYFRKECLPNAAELEFRPSGSDSHCVAGRLSVSLPRRKGRPDSGPEGAHTRGRRWCRQLRRTICEKRRVAGGSDLPDRQYVRMSEASA
jgi:hypothetical protein